MGVPCGGAVVNTLRLSERPEWMRSALCAQADPDRWFPVQGGDMSLAKWICARCDVRAQCLAYALARDEPFGIWGGLSAKQRRHLARTRARRAA